MQQSLVCRTGGVRRRVASSRALGALLVLTLVAPPFAAGSGEPDGTFGSGGQQTLPIFPPPPASVDKDDVGYAMAVDDLDRIVIAGSVSNPKRFAMMRLEPNGGLDAAFNAAGGGRLVLPIPGRNPAEALAVAVYPGEGAVGEDPCESNPDDGNDAGKIVVAGYGVQSSRDRTTLARLLPNGDLDCWFGSAGATPGIVTTPMSSSATEDDRAQAIAIQDDGKIVVAGYVRASASDFDVAVARYTRTGEHDLAFSGDGTLTLDPGTGKSEARAVALDGAGRILVAGYVLEGSEQDLLVARVTAGGALDTTFNGTGFVRIDVGGGNDVANAIAVLDDGDILVAGEGRVETNTEFVVVRLDPSGALDPAFGSEGVTTTPIGTTAQGRGLAVHPRGRIVVAGTARVDGNFEFVAARYRRDGSLDPTFGAGGLVTVSFGDKRDEANAVALQGSGGIVVAGTAQPGASKDFAAARLLSDDCGDGFLDAEEECDGDDLGGTTCCSLQCTLLDAGTTCRAAGAGCDLAETCSGSDAVCPEDAFAAEGVTCREAQGACDLAETCDGIGPACPADLRVEAGVPCRASAGVCDPQEACDGSAATCPADLRAGVETPCRSASDACDAAESCDGAAVDCPPDLALPADSVCRPAAGLCDVAETCDGSGFACPTDEILAAETPCRVAAGVCDLEEVCDGESAVCPEDLVVEQGTTCREVDGACDLVESCDGVSGLCPDDDRLPDQDGDDICDPDDLCPEIAGAEQVDGDGDGLGDACDPCTGGAVVAKTKLRITGYDTAPGDDVFFWKGILRFTEAPPFDPETTGARVVLEDPSGARLFDALLPPGAFDTETRSGWKANDARSVFIFKTDDPVDGLVKKLRLTRRNKRPNRVIFRVDGKAGSYAQLPPNPPTTAILAIDPAQASAGLCGDKRFPGPEPEPYCRLDEEETRLTCR